MNDLVKDMPDEQPDEQINGDDDAAQADAGADSVSSSYQINLEGLFDGPMDLLVHLVKKHELDIYDIPIALIAKKYLEYLELMLAVNIDVAGDFLLMAATLAYIKSRTLLPAEPRGDEEESEDPRMEIARPLAEYLQLQAAAQELESRDQLDWDLFPRSDAEEEESKSDSADTLIEVNLFELIDAFQKIVKRLNAADLFNVTVEAISVKSRIAEIIDLLETKGSVTFEELFEEDRTRRQIVVTFLALLEMAKAQIVRIMQHLTSGIIRVLYG